MTRSPKPRKPEVGDMINGCRHANACGSVARVGRHVSDDGMDHWWVTEDWNETSVRVKREADGRLYEVELVLPSG